MDIDSVGLFDLLERAGEPNRDKFLAHWFQRRVINWKPYLNYWPELDVDEIQKSRGKLDDVDIEQDASLAIRYMMIFMPDIVVPNVGKHLPTINQLKNEGTKYRDFYDRYTPGSEEDIVGRVAIDPQSKMRAMSYLQLFSVSGADEMGKHFRPSPYPE